MQFQLLALFGAPKLTLEYITEFNQHVNPVAYFAVPFILLLAILELVAQYRERKKDVFHPKEAFASFLTGLGYLLSSYLTKAFIFGIIVWVYNITPWRQQLNWWMFIPCYIIHDFSSYWKHRISHHSRFWWSIHIPHHSANHYNLWINFRQSWFEQFSVVFYLPMLLFGFHPVLYFIVHQLNALLQFWVHTEYIGRFPAWIEYLFVTPTAHKVHHASNEKYLDKNFGNNILLWDRMFGTYQALDEKPVYGLTEPIHTNNIIHIVFDEAVDILKDVKNAGTFRKKLWMLFGSPAKIAKAKKQSQRREIPEPVTV